MVILLVDWGCYLLEIKRQNDTAELNPLFIVHSCLLGNRMNLIKFPPFYKFCDILFALLYSKTF